MKDQLRRVLVVLLGSIGDVTRGLAVARALKAHGGFEITWLVEPKSADIVRMCPDVDRVLIFKRGAGVRALWKVGKVVRQSRFDIVLDLQRHAKSGLFSYLSGAPRRVGFHPRNTKELNHWFNNEYIEAWNVDAAQPRSSKLAAYLAFLRPLEVAVPARPEWRIEEWRIEERRIEEWRCDLALQPQVRAPQIPVLQASTPQIGLVLGSSWESKNWMGNEPLVRRLLAESGDEIVLFGDSKMSELATTLRALDPRRVRSTVGTLTLPGLVSALRTCRAVIGPDSGPGHLCAALGIPYVGIFGPTDALLTAPAGCEDLALSAQLGCAPCYRRSCPGLGQLCLRLVTPTAVIDRLVSLNQRSI